MIIPIDYNMCHPFQGTDEKGQEKKKKGITEGEIQNIF